MTMWPRANARPRTPSSRTAVTLQSLLLAVHGIPAFGHKENRSSHTDGDPPTTKNGGPPGKPGATGADSSASVMNANEDGANPVLVAPTHGPSERAVGLAQPKLAAGRLPGRRGLELEVRQALLAIAGGQETGGRYGALGVTLVTGATVRALEGARATGGATGTRDLELGVWTTATGRRSRRPGSRGHAIARGQLGRRLPIRRQAASLWRGADQCAAAVGAGGVRVAGERTGRLAVVILRPAAFDGAATESGLHRRLGRASLLTGGDGGLNLAEPLTVVQVAVSVFALIGGLSRRQYRHR